MNRTKSTNSTRDIFASWFMESSSWNWYVWNIFVWLFPIICLQGAVANACSFYVIVSNRKIFPYVTRQYLSIITMNDCFILTLKASTHYFIYMAYYVKDNAWTWYTTPRHWGLSWCIAYDFITYYSVVGSQFFQLGLTVDRLVAVAAPLKARMILTHRRSWILLGLISAMALVLPTMYVSNRAWDRVTLKCIHRDINFNRRVYQEAEMYYGRVFLSTSLVLGTITICLLLAWNNRTARKMQGETSSTINQQRQRSLVRTSLMLVFINFMFLCTSLPWNILQMLDMSQIKLVESVSDIIIVQHFNTLIYMNSAFCWPVYFMGSNFRQAFKRIFLSTCLRPRVRSCNCCKLELPYLSRQGAVAGTLAENFDLD